MSKRMCPLCTGQSGGGKNAVKAPLGAIEPGWSVAKIKRVGADNVIWVWCGNANTFKYRNPNATVRPDETLRIIEGADHIYHVLTPDQTLAELTIELTADWFADRL